MMPPPTLIPRNMLLAVDLGLRAGLACFDDRPALLWYRSSNFGSPTRMKKAIALTLDALPGLRYITVEGGGPLYKPWEKAARERDIRIIHLSAEDWRAGLLHPREQRSGATAKQVALEKAREVIDHLGAARPVTPLGDDVAEAILAGWWSLLRLGWATPIP